MSGDGTITTEQRSAHEWRVFMAVNGEYAYVDVPVSRIEAEQAKWGYNPGRPLNRSEIDTYLNEIAKPLLDNVFAAHRARRAEQVMRAPESRDARMLDGESAP